MKLTGSLVFLGVLAGAYGAVFSSRHRDNDFEDAMPIHYRIWGENPWDYPGNPPPIFPPDDFLRYSQIGRWWNREKPWENPSRDMRDALTNNKDDDTDEYRMWGKFPWERPGNPPPFSPPADTMTFSQIGRWRNQDENAEKPWPSLRPFLSEIKDEDAEEYRLWGKFPWERPVNPPPFVPPPDTATFSQIGRWWNQEEIGKRPTKLSRDSVEERYDEKEFKLSPTQNVEEKRGKFLHLFPSKDHKLRRIARSVWQNKPWEKPWNPPPFLPGRYPPLQ
ncbi:uncharacterized protein [Dermacentor andersoni]|uniref:uncharacterized protein n=1 Tax=Dermacentor andersoni TaxID=34620 RepID=UPI00241685E5|nr:uncharacterized protein LOC126540499 [Dermacentor andersoni]